MSVQFDKRLAELDAYLQMLIEESDILDKKIQEVSNASEREGLCLIKNNLETLLGSIKHAIVLLQIAKVSIKSEDSTSNSDNRSSKTAKVLLKQRNLITGKQQASGSPLKFGLFNKPYNKIVSSANQSVDVLTTQEIESDRCDLAVDTSDCVGDIKQIIQKRQQLHQQDQQLNVTSSPQPPARSSKQQQARRLQQQTALSSNNDLRFSQQSSSTSSSPSSPAQLDANRQNRRSLKSTSQGSSEGASLSFESHYQSSAVASTSETVASNKAVSQSKDSERGNNEQNCNNDPNVIRRPAKSTVEHELNTHNGSKATDVSLTGDSIKSFPPSSSTSHAVHEFEHEGEDDDDDAFFDAADEQHNSSQQQQQLYLSEETCAQNTDNLFKLASADTNIIVDQSEYPNSIQGNIVTSIESSTARIMSSQSQDLSLNNNNNNIVPEESIDWDQLYEEEDEEDLGSLEGQGSVIKHLLSQIRIGMDLTKVVLPTFILERRSLLEMYADFFAHPDLFSSIPDYETPEERMIQIVKWYLSAFHAGRKSSVAKKPYNPILGEIFLCHWNLEGDGTERRSSQNGPTKSNMKNTKEKSVDECSNSVESTTSSSSDNIEKISKNLPKNSLLFVAEQVSHHPPVSAFYAENREKSITCCAHIYTKSKYLGLSVGVHNIGHGEIKLLKRNETYVCTFPSAYGRSILTVPWVELGGSVNITCEQTGYSAKIEFVTKPFYGGKKHRVIGEILRPNNEPFVSIDGEWNGCMYSKSPPNSSEKDVFVDTTRLPVIKKHVRPVSVQESYESRNVWKEVTRALKLRDVATATAAKSYIEQRQRDLLKDRTEKGQKWKTRYFEPIDSGWDYSKALTAGEDQ